MKSTADKRNLVALALLALFTSSLVASPLGSAFTYQGRLNDGGNPANGSYDLQFAVVDASSGGSQLGSTLTNAATAVSNGLFTVTLDFGSGVFTGASRWLAIGVRTNGSGPFVPLSPPQPITPAPYAIMANSTSNLLGTLPSSQLAGTYSNPVTFSAASGSFRGSISGNGAGLTNLTVSAANLTGVVPLAQLPAAVVTNNESGVSLSGTFSGNGAGLTNLPSGFKWQAVATTLQQAQPNNGYVALNAAQTTINLPLLPAIGDVVRVSGAGAGGWKITQNASQSVLTANLGPVGSTWTPRATSLNWRCVASSADGAKLVAGVDGGAIYTSTDSGVNWTARVGTAQWYCVASSADGTKLVAGVNNGPLYTSTDSGVNWTPRTVGRQWYSVASSTDGTKLVAVVLNGPIYTSTDSGVNWTPRTGNLQWYSVASSADGTKLVVGVNGGTIYTSTDSGVNWTPRESSRQWYSVASSADGTQLVAGANLGQIYTSTESGATWSPRDSSRQWYSVDASADGTKLVAVANLGQIHTSTDSGVTWSPRDSNRPWYSTAISADGTKMVAVAYGGQIYTSGSATTTPGTAGYLIGGQNAAIELQYIGSGQFLPLSHEGALYAY